MIFSCAEKAFKFLAQKYDQIWRKNYTKIGAYTETQNRRFEVTHHIRQSVSKRRVRNHDFVDFQRFPIAYFFEDNRFTVQF